MIGYRGRVSTIGTESVGKRAGWMGSFLTLNTASLVCGDFWI